MTLLEPNTPPPSDSKNRSAVPSFSRSSVRWFASELTVVVAGILIALALQAWWQDRQDEARAAEYEQRILSDLRQTERTFRESIGYDRAHYEAAKQFSAAIRRPEPPNTAELFSWLKANPGWFADPRPILGNVDALIRTGDIRLIHDQRKRAAIIQYASLMTSAWEDRDTQSDRMLRANDLALARLESMNLSPLLASLSKDGTLAPEEVQGSLASYHANWHRLKSDGDFKTAQQWRLLAYRNILDYNQEMLEATSRVVKLLEARSR